MENMVLKVTLCRHNGVVLPSVCCIFFIICGMIVVTSAFFHSKQGMDERVLSEEDRCGGG